MAKQLQRFEADSILIEKIFELYPSYLVKDEDIYSKFYGYYDRNIIYYNKEYLVITEDKFNYAAKQVYGKNIVPNPVHWKQVVVRLDDTVSSPSKIITGTYAYNYVNNNILLKEYNKDEVEEILYSHIAEYDPSLKQFHYDYNVDQLNTVYKIKEVYKYDIHKAHASVLMTLFPKCKKRILAILNKAQKAKEEGNIAKSREYKAYINYYIGALCNHGHRLTYNYIVQSITRKLIDTYNKLGGQLIYANTDSLCVVNPMNILPDIPEYGEFGLEYHGPAYVVYGNNYVLYKFDDYVGSCRKAVRDKFDLENGIICNYKINRNNNIMEIKDICIEKVNVVEL